MQPKDGQNLHAQAEGVRPDSVTKLATTTRTQLPQWRVHVAAPTTTVVTVLEVCVQRALVDGNSRPRWPHPADEAIVDDLRRLAEVILFINRK